MRKVNYILIIAICVILNFLSVVNAKTTDRNFPPPLRATYDTPAKIWESEALPIGNGYMGAMIFGGVYVDVIQTNEHTLWSGGPSENPGYNGGHLRTPEINKDNLQKARNLLQQKMIDFMADKAAHFDANGKLITYDYEGDGEGTDLRRYIDNIAGTKEHFGSYQTLSNIVITSNNTKCPDCAYSDYNRTLDIDNSIHTVSYKESGITYKREYFMSYPDNVMVIRLTSDSKDGISRTIALESLHKTKNIISEGNTITMTGYPTPVGGDKRVGDHWKNGLRYAQQVMVRNDGGKISAVDGMIKVAGAKEIVILMSAATNYVQCMDDSYNFFSKEDPLDKVKAILKKASAKSYKKLLIAHQKDYRSLYDRMKINLGNVKEAPVMTTDKLLKGMDERTNSQADNLYLEMLYYQFGRYLLISSSREGSLPANLQGVWADRLQNAWNSDYHTNINVQMNYWLAQPTNLSPCHLPMVEYVKSLVPRGRYTAQHYYCRPDGKPVRGWVTHHENNIWGNTAPAKKDTPHHFPAGAIWMCQDIWEYYQFNQDRKFLEEYYDTMLQAALFWVDNLWTDKRDGMLVANPSHSPEHGEYSLGCSTSQAMIWEIFNIMIKASKELGRENDPEIKEISASLAKLSGPKIGLGGQFMEWKDEVTKDINGDGIIDMDDREIVSDGPNPKFQFGLNLNAAYKGFDFSVLFQGQAGVKVYWQNALANTSTVRFGYQLNKDVAEGRWVEGRTDAIYPRLLQSQNQINTQMSDFYLENKAFLKIRNIQLGYSLPKSITKKMQLERLRFYGSLENFFTFTSYRGFDPEISGLAYPAMKSAVLGVNVTF